MKKILVVVVLSFSMLLEQRSAHAEAGLDVITITEIEAVAISNSIDEVTLAIAGAAGYTLYEALFQLPGIIPGGPGLFSAAGLALKGVKGAVWLTGVEGLSSPTGAAKAAMTNVQLLADLTDLQDDLAVYLGVPATREDPNIYVDRVVPSISSREPFQPISSSQILRTRIVFTAPSNWGAFLQLYEVDVGGLFGSDWDNLGGVLIRNFPTLYDKDLFVYSEDEESLYRIRFNYERDKGKYYDLLPRYQEKITAPSLVVFNTVPPGGVVQAQSPLDVSSLSQYVSHNTSASYSITTSPGYRPIVEGTCGGGIVEASEFLRRYVYRTAKMTGSSCNIIVRFVLADSDNDGVGDLDDDFPDDPSETKDTDGDGVGDNADDFPSDPSETKDTDGDGVGDNADDFPRAVTEIGQSDVTITAIPSNPNSECTLVREGFNPSIEMAAPGKAIAENALAFGVNFELAGCYISGETIQIIIDFGTELPPGAAAYKVIGDSWAAIPGATVRESKISYSISDNDGFLDQDPAIGRISDPVSVAVPVTAQSATKPNAIPTLPFLSLMALTILIALSGAASLVRPRRQVQSL
jgi:hypothetical protein